MNEVIYGPLIWLIKLSLFLLYLEVFARLRWLKYLVYFGIIFTGLFYFSSMAALLGLCAPPYDATQLEYLSTITSPQCDGRSKAVNVVLGIVNIVSDFYILVLPLPAVWSLQLPTAKKVGVSAIFLTGIGYVHNIGRRT